jgi:hypothetical protein
MREQYDMKKNLCLLQDPLRSPTSHDDVRLGGIHRKDKFCGKCDDQPGLHEYRDYAHQAA